MYSYKIKYIHLLKKLVSYYVVYNFWLLHMKLTRCNYLLGKVNYNVFNMCYMLQVDIIGYMMHYDPSTYT